MPDTMKLKGEYEFKTDQEKVDFLANLVEAGSQSPYIREFTLKLLNSAGIKSYDTKGEIRTIYNWVRDNIVYRRHVYCRDSFTTAERVLKLRSGDCDNASILLNSMLMSVGIPTGFRIVASRKDIPYHHIYSIVGLPVSMPTKWIPLDATDKSGRVGTEPKYAKKRDFIITCGV